MPTLSQVHVDAALTNYAVMYRPEGLISDLVFPVVPVQKASDRYYKVDPAKSALRERSTLRGPGAPAGVIDWATSTDAYSCQEHCQEQPLDDQVLGNADPAVDPRRIATAMVMDVLAIQKEIQLAATLVAAITQTAAAGAFWTADLSDPMTDINTGMQAILDATGKEPNIAFCDRKTYRALLQHPTIVGRVQYAQVATQQSVDQAVAGILGLDAIYVSKARKNTSRASTPSLSAVWGTTFFLAYVDRTPSLMTQTLGTTFAWNGVPGGVGGTAVDVYRWEKSKSDNVRATRNYDQKVVDAAMGYRITGCIA